MAVTTLQAAFDCAGEVAALLVFDRMQLCDGGSGKGEWC